MDQTVPQHIKFVGIDDSAPMLEKCKTKLEERGMTRPYSLEVADLNSGHVAMKDASVVILCLTLQFVRPIAREKLLRSIHEQLQPGGVLIVIEKILAEETDFNRDFIKYYYNMKNDIDSLKTPSFGKSTTPKIFGATCLFGWGLPRLCASWCMVAASVPASSAAMRNAGSGCAPSNPHGRTRRGSETPL